MWIHPWKNSVCDGYHRVSLPVTFPNCLQVWYLGSFGSLCNHWFHCQGQRVTGVRKYGSVGMENSTISMILYIHFQLFETKNPMKSWKINESMMYSTQVAIPTFNSGASWPWPGSSTEQWRYGGLVPGRWCTPTGGVLREWSRSIGCVFFQWWVC